MFKLFMLTIKLYKEYWYQRKCLASMADNNYRKAQRRIDEIYKEMHETLAVKLLSRKSFVYCQCGNDVYDGVSEILYNEDQTMELIECRKCGDLICISHEIGPCPIKVPFMIDRYGEVECPMFGKDTKIYGKLNKLVGDYIIKCKGGTV